MTFKAFDISNFDTSGFVGLSPIVNENKSRSAEDVKKSINFDINTQSSMTLFSTSKGMYTRKTHEELDSLVENMIVNVDKLSKDSKVFKKLKTDVISGITYDHVLTIKEKLLIPFVPINHSDFSEETLPTLKYPKLLQGRESTTGPKVVKRATLYIKDSIVKPILENKDRFDFKEFVGVPTDKVFSTDLVDYMTLYNSTMILLLNKFTDRITSLSKLLINKNNNKNIKDAYTEIARMLNEVINEIHQTGTYEHSNCNQLLFSGESKENAFNQGHLYVSENFNKILTNRKPTSHKYITCFVVMCHVVKTLKLINNVDFENTNQKIGLDYSCRDLILALKEKCKLGEIFETVHNFNINYGEDTGQSFIHMEDLSRMMIVPDAYNIPDYTLLFGRLFDLDIVSQTRYIIRRLSLMNSAVNMKIMQDTDINDCNKFMFEHIGSQRKSFIYSITGVNRVYIRHYFGNFGYNQSEQIDYDQILFKYVIEYILTHDSTFIL